MPTIAIYAIVAALLFAGGTASGVKLTSDHYKAAELAEQKAVVAQIEAEVVRQVAASAQLEEKKDAQQVVYRTLTRTVDRIVEKPVYRNVCLDDDGLRAANAALAAAGAAGGPHPAVPGPDAARGRDRGGGAAQAR